MTNIEELNLAILGLILILVAIRLGLQVKDRRKRKGGVQ